jgi:hypothetical protein
VADGFALRIDNLAYGSAAERLMDAVGWMQGSSLILPRAGVKAGAPVTLAVLTGPDRVTVPAHGGTLLSTPASGSTSYRYVIPTAATKSFAARPSAGTSRIDLIVARVYDATADVSTALKELDVEIILGTAAASPSAPPQPNGTLLLGQATVPNSAAIVITKPPPRTVATGGIVPVADAADLATLVPYDGMVAFQEDTDVFYGRANGAWVAFSTGAGPHFRGTILTATPQATGANCTFTSVADTDSGWSTNTYTVKRAGVYRVAARFKWNGSSPSAAYINFLKNGTIVSFSPNAPSVAFGGMADFHEDSFAVNDTIAVRVGAAFTTQSDSPAHNNTLTIDWLRP